MAAFGAEVARKVIVFSRLINRSPSRRVNANSMALLGVCVLPVNSKGVNEVLPSEARTADSGDGVLAATNNGGLGVL